MSTNVALATNGGTIIDIIGLNPQKIGNAINGVSSPGSNTAEISWGGAFTIKFHEIASIGSINVVLSQGEAEVFIKYSTDNVHWTDLGNSTGGVMSFSSVEAQYVRITGVTSSTPERIYITEIEVFVIAVTCWLSDGLVDLISGAANDTLFTFSVNYTDTANIKPRTYYPKCHVMLGEKEIRNGLMSPVEFMNFTYTDGKAYEYKCMLPYRGEYTFWFEVSNNVYDYARVDGQQTISVAGVNATPQLAWTGEVGYESGGVLNGNAVGEYTEFRVKYTDMNNDPPQDGVVMLYIYDYTTGELLYEDMMDFVSGSPSVGMIFRKSILPPTGGSSSGLFVYKFTATDTYATAAIGSPCLLHVFNYSVRPVLHYAGGEGFENSYVAHVVNENGTITFNYRVVYQHLKGDKPYPGHPRVDTFYKGNDVAGHSLKKMAATLGESTNYANGVEFYGSYTTPNSSLLLGGFAFALTCKNKWGTEYNGIIYPPIQSAVWQEKYARQTDLKWKYVWVDTEKKDIRIEPLLNVEQGIPYKYCINTNLIILNAVQTGSLLLDYVSAPAKMVAESDIVSIPDSEIETAVLYLLERVYKKLNQWDESRIVQRDYNERIVAVHKMAQTQRPSLFFEPGGGY